MVLKTTVQIDNLSCIFFVSLSFGTTAQDRCEIVEKGVKVGHFFTISIHTCSGLALRRGENGEVFCSGFPFDATKVMETSLRWGRIFTRKIELLLLQVAFSSAHILERYISKICKHPIQPTTVEGRLLFKRTAKLDTSQRYVSARPLFFWVLVF